MEAFVIAKCDIVQSIRDVGAVVTYVEAVVTARLLRLLIIYWKRLSPLRFAMFFVAGIVSQMKRMNHPMVSHAPNALGKNKSGKLHSRTEHFSAAFLKLL